MDWLDWMCPEAVAVQWCDHADAAIDLEYALDCLTDEDRRMLVEHDCLGMTLRELSAFCGYSPHTIGLRLRRARARLLVILSA